MNHTNKLKVVLKDGTTAKMETVAEFCARHAGLTPQAVTYARQRGKLDYWVAGKVVLILLTPRTMAYRPQVHKARGLK